MGPFDIAVRPVHKNRSSFPGLPMTKLLSLLIVAMMALHLIRPLGLPGLRKRRDFWKLAVLALAAMMITVALSHT
ncbi:hypothetical protein NTH_01997 [Nitratireductor thuwali]|uniref:Uncharacterized protein n=2 Tax=Nitratireductor thuwali TaxID=2267699 RepID=A0ABY5MHQ6_9HYPH|nr:hypothetical protein NTH_01997 [Nitratireductor thuwali]